jgi:hypothetical protein
MMLWEDVAEPPFDVDLIQKIVVFDLVECHNEEELQIVQKEESN